MPRKLRDRVEEAYHHVFARGNRKGDVFRDDEDRRWFLKRLLQVEFETRSIHVAHCLMTNHIHLLFRPGEPGVSKVLQRVMGSYTQWFNRRHGCVGHVFQGRFGSRVIDSDSDLLWIIRYIHRNPVEAGIVPRPELWKWSSHADHLRPIPPAYVREGAIFARSLLGGDHDCALILYRRLVESRDGDFLIPLDSESRGEHPVTEQGWTSERPVLDEIALQVEERFSLARGVLCGTGRMQMQAEARRAFCRAAIREWGYTLTETAAFLGRSLSNVSVLVRREGGRNEPRDGKTIAEGNTNTKGSDPAFAT